MSSPPPLVSPSWIAAALRVRGAILVSPSPWAVALDAAAAGAWLSSADCEPGRLHCGIGDRVVATLGDAAALAWLRLASSSRTWIAWYGIRMVPARLPGYRLLWCERRAWLV